MGLNDETVRTKAINFTHSHWKTVLHFASWAFAAIVTISVATGKKQAHTEDDAALSKDALARIEAKVDGVVIDVSAIKVKQASAEMSEKDRDARMSRMEDNWDNAFQHAGDTPRPGHRTRH